MKALKINGFEFTREKIFHGEKTESISVKALWTYLEKETSITSCVWLGVNVEVIR